MNRNFGKVTDSQLALAPDAVYVTIDHHESWTDEEGQTHTDDWQERVYKYPPNAEDYKACGYLPNEYTQATPAEGMQATTSHWVSDGNTNTQVWDYAPIAVTESDYDAAMEEHLTEERIARGYTTREPSDYAASSVPRFAQDAADWIAHRDEVMVYALAVINEYKATGIAPSLAEFKAGLPVIQWTIDGEGV